MRGYIHLPGVRTKANVPVVPRKENAPVASVPAENSPYSHQEERYIRRSFSQSYSLQNWEPQACVTGSVLCWYRPSALSTCACMYTRRVTSLYAISGKYCCACRTRDVRYPRADPPRDAMPESMLFIIVVRSVAKAVSRRLYRPLSSPCQK